MKLIDPFNLPENHQLIHESESLGASDEDFKIIMSHTTIYLQQLTKPLFGKSDIPNYDVYQIELTISACHWVAKTIEHKFWKNDSQGGLPKGIYTFKETVDDERLALYREMNAGAKNQKGFRLTNFSRPSRTYKDENYQDFFITDLQLIEGGLLDILKRI